MGKIWMPGGGGGADLDVITAGAGDVLAGKVIVDKEGELLTGTMPNRGASGGLLQAGQTYTIPAGYHNGSGTVAANNLAGQTGATAAAAHILNGQTAWVNGNKITGNMPNYSTTPTPIDAIRMNNNRFEVAVTRGFHGYSWDGGGYEYMSYDQVANAIGLTPARIKKGEWILGRQGTWEGYVSGTTDLYYRGNNVIGFVNAGSNRTLIFDSGQITIAYVELSSSIDEPKMTGTFNTIGKTYLNFEINITGIRANSTSEYLNIFFPNVSRVQAGPFALGTRTYSINVQALQMNANVRFEFNRVKGAVYRVWLS